MASPCSEPANYQVRAPSQNPEVQPDLRTQLTCLPLGRLFPLQREWEKSLAGYTLQGRRGLGAEEIYLDPNLERGLRLLLEGKLFCDRQNEKLNVDAPVIPDLLAQQAITPFLPNDIGSNVILSNEELFKRVCGNVLPSQSPERIAKDLTTHEPVLKCGYLEMGHREKEIYLYHQQLFHRAYALELLDAELQRRSIEYRHQHVRSISWVDPLHEQGQFLVDVVNGIRDKSNLCLEDTLTALAIIDKYQIPWATEKEIAQFKIDLQKHACSFQERKLRQYRRAVDQADNPDGPFAWFVNNAYNYAYSAPGEQSNLAQTAVSFLVDGSQGSRAVWFTLQKAEAKWEEVKKAVNPAKSLPQFLADYRRYSRDLDSCLAEVSSHLNTNGQSVDEWAKIDQSLTATMLAFATVASLSKGDTSKAERALNLVMTASAWNFTLDAAQQLPTGSYDFGRGAEAISDGGTIMAATLVPELRPAAATTTLLPEYLAHVTVKRTAGQVLMNTGKRWVGTTTEAGIAGAAMGAANGYKASLIEQADPLTAIQNITTGTDQGAEGGLVVGGLVGAVPPAFKGLKVTGARLARDARSLPRYIRATGNGLRNVATGTRNFFDSSADKLVWWLYRDFPIAPAGEIVPGLLEVRLPRAEPPRPSSVTPTNADLLPSSLRGKTINMSANTGSAGATGVPGKVVDRLGLAIRACKDSGYLDASIEARNSIRSDLGMENLFSRTLDRLKEAHAKGQFHVVVVSGRSGLPFICELLKNDIPVVPLKPLRQHSFRPGSELLPPCTACPTTSISPAELRAVMENKLVYFIDDQAAGGGSIEYARAVVKDSRGQFLGASTYCGKGKGAVDFLGLNEIDILLGEPGIRARPGRYEGLNSEEIWHMLRE